jgi:hypothetical protein
MDSKNATCPENGQQECDMSRKWIARMRHVQKMDSKNVTFQKMDRKNATCPENG